MIKGLYIQNSIMSKKNLDLGFTVENDRFYLNGKPIYLKAAFLKVYILLNSHIRLQGNDD